MYAVFFFPGALMTPESMAGIKAEVAKGLPEDDTEFFDIAYDYPDGFWNQIDKTYQTYRVVLESAATRIVFVGESMGADFSADLRKKYNIDALILGSSPGASRIYTDRRQRIQQYQKSRKHYAPLFRNTPMGRLLIEKWYYWGVSAEPISDVHWVEEDRAILFTGVRRDRRATAALSSKPSVLTPRDLDKLQSNPNIIAINIENGGHRVMSNHAETVAQYSLPYILDRSRPTSLFPKP